MVLHESRARDGLEEIGIVSGIVTINAETFGGSHIICRTKHVEMLVHALKADVAFVGYSEAASCAFLRGEHDDARGSARAIL